MHAVGNQSVEDAVIVSRLINGRGLICELEDAYAGKLVAGGVGAVAGVLIGAVRGQPALRLGVTVGTNFLVAASCFGGISPSGSFFTFFHALLNFWNL